MTTKTIATFTAIIAAILGAAAYLVVKHPTTVYRFFHIPTGVGDSPIVVAGGSIHFLVLPLVKPPSGTGWLPVGNCAPASNSSVDACQYYTSSTVDTTQNILIENVTDSGGMVHIIGYPISIPVAISWTINVYAPDMNGIQVCSSVQTGGGCDTVGTSGYVTMQPIPLTPYGLYPGDPPHDKRYHNPAMGTSGCPGNHCEDMNQIQVTVNGSEIATSPFSCITSAGCRIGIGGTQR